MDQSVQTITGVRAFTDSWPAIADAVGHAFRMSDAERSWLRDKRVARLIAAIPFVAGCRHPERTAVTHLGTYILSGRETASSFHASVDDDSDILDRLRPIMTFRGGDRTLVDAGMAFLALNMLEDYRDDIQIDAALGKYNPVASGAFRFETIRSALLAMISPEARDTYAAAIDGDPGTLAYWYD
tara:strand:+ start:697 stop:1248 length:552 start_codon:yes stop_codon:yes gene_type:complete